MKESEQELSKEQIDWNEVFYYDETSPSCLRWKTDRTTGFHGKIFLAREGDIAGFKEYKDKNYRVGVTIKGNKHRLIPVHQIIWELENGRIPEGFIVDHKDGKGTNNEISNLRLVTREVNNRNRAKHKRNTTGKNGVVLGSTKYLDKEYFYYIAHWSELNGKVKTKSFSWIKYGKDKAFELASEFRDKMIEQLNAQGAGYTERHGKDQT
jgi:hypothetical protein